MLFIARPSSARLGVTAGLNGGVLRTGLADCGLAATDALFVEAVLTHECGERGERELVSGCKFSFPASTALPVCNADCVLVAEGEGKEELVLLTADVVRLGTLNTVTEEEIELVHLVVDVVR